MVSLGTRIYTTVLVAFAWFAFLLAFLALGASSYTVDQDLTILLASGLVTIAVLVSLWLRWTFHR